VNQRFLVGLIETIIIVTFIGAYVLAPFVSSAYKLILKRKNDFESLNNIRMDI
jgi:hypothetical protein